MHRDGVVEIGAANATLLNGPVIPGKSFDRIIQIWLENTDCAYLFLARLRSKLLQLLLIQIEPLSEYSA